MEIITTKFEDLQEPPAPKRWKNIWRNELEDAVQNNQNLYSPDYNEIKRHRKRKKVIVKSKRKIRRKKEVKKCTKRK